MTNVIKMPPNAGSSPLNPEGQREVTSSERDITRTFQSRFSVIPNLSFRYDNIGVFFDAKLIWDVTLPEKRKLLEQESANYVVRQRRRQAYETYLESYFLLNAIKRPDQKAYGADMLDFHYDIFDNVDGVPIDSANMGKTEFFVRAVKEYGAAIARQFAFGIRGIDKHYGRVVLDNKGLPIEVRLSEFPCVSSYVDLESAFDSISDVNPNLNLLGASKGAKVEDVDVKQLLLDGFLSEYARIQQLWGPEMEAVLRRRQEDFLKQRGYYIYLVDSPNAAFNKCNGVLSSFPIQYLKKRVQETFL